MTLIRRIGTDFNAVKGEFNEDLKDCSSHLIRSIFLYCLQRAGNGKSQHSGSHVERERDSRCGERQREPDSRQSGFSDREHQSNGEGGRRKEEGGQAAR